MRLRSARPLWMGLAASALLHAGLFFTGLIDSPVAQVETAALPFEARLELPAAPAGALTRLPAAAIPAARQAPRPAMPPAEAAQEQPDATAPKAPTEQAEAVAFADAEGLSPPAPPAQPQASAAPADEPSAPLNPLPRRINMEYDVSYGPASGRQTLVWVNEGDRYTITSVAAATGLTSLFYSGRFMQTSQGRTTSAGLQPEAFWDQRGSKRSSGRFDAALRTLTVSRGNAVKTFSLPEHAQDTQSLLFQFALTAPHIESGAYAVFTGKNLRPYHFAVRGEETLNTALGELRTLHIERMNAAADGRFEAWLAIDLHYLPVRVLRVEESGAEGELAVRSIDVGE